MIIIQKTHPKKPNWVLFYAYGNCFKYINYTHFEYDIKNRYKTMFELLPLSNNQIDIIMF